MVITNIPSTLFVQLKLTIYLFSVAKCVNIYHMFLFFLYLEDILSPSGALYLLSHFIILHIL